MRIKHLYCIGSALLLWASCYGSSVSRLEPDKATLQQLDEIVSDYRKIIVLLNGQTSLDSGNRERVSIVGKMLFQQDHERLASLSVSLSNDLGNSGSPQIESFLDAVEKNQEYHDADKLVFREVFDDLADGMRKPGYSSAPATRLEKRVAEDIAALDQIQALYQKELAQVFENFQKRGMPVRREAWDRYLVFLKQKYSREQILKESFGNLVGSEGGDFIFDLKHDSEFLSSNSNQLSDDAIRLNTELERLRSQNEELKQQLAAVQSQQAKQTSRTGAPAAETALTLNDEGMRLYKEKNYSEAAAKFMRAAELDPTSALAANNAGFAFYKQEKYETQSNG
jgi:hypothetical protein